VAKNFRVSCLAGGSEMEIHAFRNLSRISILKTVLCMYVYVYIYMQLLFFNVNVNCCRYRSGDCSKHSGILY